MVTSKPTQWAEVDEQGRLVLPPGMAARFGLTPGARLRLEDDDGKVRLHRPLTHLARIYVEPTIYCNLDCITCLRNVWDERLGRMKPATFDRILEGIRAVEPRPLVFFGGIGEPLFHPQLADMVARTKALGATVELITNGTLLNDKKARELIEAGLDVIWISIDGATPESYADVRLGAELPHVLENITHLRQIRPGGHHPQPKIGIAFVAMKRNIKDLPAVLNLARRLGASFFKVSNVLPYTEQLRTEILYDHLLNDIAYMPSTWLPHLSLPKMEINEDTAPAIFQAFRSGFNVSLAGHNLGGNNDVCNFVESGALAVGWDGGVAPCLPLLHNHSHFLKQYQRVSRRHIVGNVNQRDLLDIWHDPSYVAYRERVQSFAFAPCTFCGGCDLIEGNEEDCLGNTFPVCGGCLWAQGVIQCP